MAFRFALSIFLIFGILVSYFPQAIRITRLRSSYGYSIWSLVLGLVSLTCNLINATLERFLSEDGSHLTLGWIQIIVQYGCLCSLFVLYYLYHPHKDDHAGEIACEEESRSKPGDQASEQAIEPGATETAGKASFESESSLLLSLSSASLSSSPAAAAAIAAVLWAPIRRSGLYALYMYLFFLMAVLLLTLVVAFYFFPLVPLLKRCLTVLSVSCCLIQYVPQIWHTMAIQAVGSLSILTMSIQTPGSLLMVYSLSHSSSDDNATKPGLGWTVYLSYLMSGLMQGILLAICLYYHCRKQQPEVERAHLIEGLLENQSN